MPAEIIIYTLSISFVIQFLYYTGIYSRVLITVKNLGNKKDLPPLSVIISTNNEADNVQNFLPLILNQDYNKFELIVVNDRSTDKTQDILNQFQEIYNNLKVIIINELSEKISGKKNALTKAIETAKHEHLIFTDADCYPVSKNWLRTIANSYTKKTEIVIGYGGYEKQKGFLNKIIRFETLFNAMQYMSFALLGFPYMGVGRNLSYKKSLFLQNNGFSTHKKITSGDDDLFINKTANKKNTEVLINNESITISIPKTKFKDYLKQKRRHLSTGKYYKQKHKLLLGTEILSRFFFYIGIIFSLFFQKFNEIALIMYSVKLLSIFIITKSFSGKLKEKHNLFFIPIFDILIPVINLFIYISTLFNNKIEWK